jgi:ABC-type uncharacterized transport system substrate-binding protein
MGQNIMHNGKYVALVKIMLVIGLLVSPMVRYSQAENTRVTKAKWKILHIMSYHSPWEWTDNQFNGFKDALKDLDIEYRVLQMDTKRQNSMGWKQYIGEEAKQLIDTWHPDLVYTSDDMVQEVVAKYYINSTIPFVFSGVNADPKKYRFDGSKNITGVLEQEHFVQTVQLLKEIVPSVSKIAVILDDDPPWDGVVARMKEQTKQLQDVEFVSWHVIATFEEYQHTIKELEDKVDAIASMGIFTFKDAHGKNVPYPTVLKWTVENSTVPDFSFWESRIGPGTLCTVTVSGYEQGLAAGKIAPGILVEGRSPASYAMAPTVKGEPIVSLARAKRLGLSIKTSILLTARVIEKFDWE